MDAPASRPAPPLTAGAAARCSRARCRGDPSARRSRSHGPTGQRRWPIDVGGHGAADHRSGPSWWSSPASPSSRDLDGLAWLPEPVDPGPPVRAHRHRDHRPRQRHRARCPSSSVSAPGRAMSSSPASCCCRSSPMRPATSTRWRRSSRRMPASSPTTAAPSTGRLLVTRYRLHGRQTAPVRARTSTSAAGARAVEAPPARCPPGQRRGGHLRRAAGARPARRAGAGPLSRLPALRSRSTAAGRARAQPPGRRLDGPAAAGAGAGAGAGGSHGPCLSCGAPRRPRWPGPGLCCASAGTPRRWPASMRPWSGCSSRGRRSATRPSPWTGRGR